MTTTIEEKKPKGPLDARCFHVEAGKRCTRYLEGAEAERDAIHTRLRLLRDGLEANDDGEDEHDAELMAIGVERAIEAALRNRPRVDERGRERATGVGGRDCRHGEPEEIYCAMCDEAVVAEVTERLRMGKAPRDGRVAELETAISRALDLAVDTGIIGSECFAILQAVAHDGISEPPQWTSNDHQAQDWLATNIGRGEAMNARLVGSLAKLLLAAREDTLRSSKATPVDDTEVLFALGTRLDAEGTSSLTIHLADGATATVRIEREPQPGAPSALDRIAYIVGCDFLHSAEDVIESVAGVQRGWEAAVWCLSELQSAEKNEKCTKATLVNNLKDRLQAALRLGPYELRTEGARLKAGDVVSVGHARGVVLPDDPGSPNASQTPEKK